MLLTRKLIRFLPISGQRLICGMTNNTVGLPRLGSLPKTSVHPLAAVVFLMGDGSLEV